ncbi:MAG: hypothetical protein HY048_13945 [Acidobacteria bacterium]|nr:hypothetical protein [Acidobacteriota bacterium]
MPRHFPSRHALLALALLALVASPGHGQTADAGAQQIDAALAANQSNPALQTCLRNDSSVDDYQRAVLAVERSRDPSVPAKFNCSGIGASWQEVAPSACCSVFDRDKGRGVDAAWIALQQCGWRNAVEQRRPAYLQSARKCLASSNLAVATPPPSPPARGGDPWRGTPSFDQIRSQIVGHDACAVTGGPAWTMFDNAGRQRLLPGFLADRIQPRFAVLDDRAWLAAALPSLRGAPSVDDALVRMSAGGPGIDKQFVWFGETFVRQDLPNASLSTVVGREEGVSIARISSEHSSVRGTCNGGGDFIRFIPSGAGPRIILAAWTLAAPDDADVRLEMPSAVVTADGGFARVVADLAPSGAAAILITSGRVQVREAATGASQRVAAGEAVLVWPGLGVSQPVRAGTTRFSTASRPRIRGSIVLQPGQEWAGPLRIDGGLLPLEARLLYDKPAGANYGLEIVINGRRVADPLVNKMSPMRYADGRNYPYREPNSAKWLLFYSADYEANNGPAGGMYEVKTDSGQAYRYVWDVAPLTGGNAVAQVQFRNSSNPPAPLELRLLPTQTDQRYPPAVTQFPRPSTPPPAVTGVTPYGSSAADGQPHLALYAVRQMLGHGDFDYPVVVQLQDGSGRPMYPASPLTVTLTSSDPGVVAMYSAARPPTATLTLKPADRSGSGGASWESVRVIAAASVAGSATLTAAAPGVAGASVTVATVPTRTGDNRSTPAQTAPAARLALMVLPPMVETNRLPYVVIDLLDAQGQPTGVGFGPGDWTLQSSNQEVIQTYSGNSRVTQLGSYPGAGQTQLTVIPKRPGLTGSTATVTAVKPGAPPTTDRATPPGPPVVTSPPASAGAVGRVVPGVAFGEPAGPSGRVSNIVTARDVRDGVAIGITDRFTPDVNPIHVWFRVAGFAPGTTLLSRWTYLGGQQPLVIGTAVLTINATNDYGTFNYELEAGKRWPAGEYRVEILSGSIVVGTTMFEVVSATK